MLIIIIIISDGLGCVVIVTPLHLTSFMFYLLYQMTDDR